MKKIKICFVSTFAYPLFNPQCKETFGGAEVQLFQLSKEFAKDDRFEVFFVVADFGQKKYETYEGVNVVKSYEIKKRISNYIKAPFKLYTCLKEIKPDIIIQRTAAPETGICAFYCKKHKKKFIYSISHKNDVSCKKKGLVGRMYNYGLEHADFIIAQNTDQVELLENLWKRKINNIQMIKTGYHISEINIKDKDSILWVSRAVSWKRPELFLELAKYFPEERFVMIMPKSFDIRIWHKIHENAKSIHNLNFIEQVPFHEVDSFFKNAKVFINTSIAEGFPNTFVQACKNKTPIISLKVNAEKFLDKYGCGFAYDDDIEKMKKGLKNILEDKELYKKCSNNAYNYAKETHDIRKIFKEWKECVLNEIK